MSQWVVVKPQLGIALKHWESAGEAASLEGAVAIASTKSPEWKIYHVHGEYEADPYAILRIRNANTP
jgi:hypothetical protein